MPIYTFINKLTNKKYDKVMSYEELLEYIKDPNRPEDVDTKASDHAYDALRYLIMSRPRSPTPYERMNQVKKWVPSDRVFGY